MDVLLKKRLFSYKSKLVVHVVHKFDQNTLPEPSTETRKDLKKLIEYHQKRTLQFLIEKNSE